MNRFWLVNNLHCYHKCHLNKEYRFIILFSSSCLHLHSYLVFKLQYMEALDIRVFSGQWFAVKLVHIPHRLTRDIRPLVYRLFHGRIANARVASPLTNTSSQHRSKQNQPGVQGKHVLAFTVYELHQRTKLLVRQDIDCCSIQLHCEVNSVYFL